MRRRRVISWLAGGVVMLAACGSPATVDPTAAPSAQPDSTEPADAGAVADPAAEPDRPDATDALGGTEATDAPADDPTATATDPTAEPATEATTGASPSTATSVPDTTAAPGTTEPVPRRADDGCSADNTATDTSDGPLPTVEVRAESAGSPLPDLAVRRINCAGGWVNLKNELPSDKPLLVWFWAPH